MKALPSRVMKKPVASRRIDLKIPLLGDWLLGGQYSHTPMAPIAAKMKMKN